MAAIVISGFVLSILSPLIYRFLRTGTGWAVAAFAAGLTAYFAGYIGPVSSGQVFEFRHTWFPGLGISFSFLLDGLSLVFSLMITAIGTLVFAYSASYFSDNSKTPRFYFHMLIFMASMLGMVLSENLVTMFVFWELTSISSYMLIGFYHERDTSRNSALQALLITAGGGLCLLAGIIILGQITGTYGMAELLSSSGDVVTSPLYFTALILVLLGAFTKSAQFPFHFWLPSAMEAPTPVSAYLHSATMVTAGIYLLARLNPILGGTPEWHYIITTIGAITMLLGAIISFYQSDLKRILAYSTVSVLGTLTMLLGLDTTLSVKAAIVLLIAHSLYKASLFLIAGSVDHETGTRDINQLRGLRKAMPVTAFAATLAALSMAGLPPLFGFIAKEVIYEAKLEIPDLTVFITAAGILTNILLIGVAGMLSLHVFYGSRIETTAKPHEAPFSMVLGPVILSIAGLLVGLFPNTLATPLIASAVSAVRAEDIVLKLALWHGVNTVLILGIITILCGFVAYLLRNYIRQLLSHIPEGLKADNVYFMCLSLLNKTARAQTVATQSGYISRYIILTILTTILLVGGTFLFKANVDVRIPITGVQFYEFLVFLSILIGIIVTLTASSRLAAVVGLGVVGFGITIIFILFGAPDLAITQFAIETLTVILFVLVIYKLPRFLQLSSTAMKLRDGVLALFLGGLVTVLLLGVLSMPMESELKEYFGNVSLSEAYGLNVVNVILVDFRALDTFGEVIVLAVAAIGIYTLLKLRMEK